MDQLLVPRLASPADADAVAGLLDAANTEFDAASPPPPVLAERLRHLLDEPSTFAVVAGRPLAAVALVTLRPNVWYGGPVGLVDELYVAPRLRNQGIGTAVIERVELECRRRGAELIEINVDAGDVGAQRFYERHGFAGTGETTGERAFYYAREL